MKKFHPLADIFPLLDDAGIADLAEDIKANGLHHAICLHPNGQIVDGRNRWLACKEAKVQPGYRTWSEENDGPLLNFVISENVKRRHLNESQRAIVAAKLATMKQGARTDIVQICAMSQEDAANLLNVSRRSAQHGNKVISSDDEELIGAVADGTITVSDAASSFELDKKRRDKVIMMVKAGKAKNLGNAVREAKRAKRVKELDERSQPIDGGLGKFPVLYADPPWRYEHVETENRAIENQYPTMDLAKICALPVGDIITDDAVIARNENYDTECTPVPIDVVLGAIKDSMLIVWEDQ